MIHTFEDIITVEELDTIRGHLEKIEFVDGKATAGGAARMVKNNQQAAGKDPERLAISDIVMTALRRHELFRSATRPRELHGLLINRYSGGEQYGLHIDNPLMGKESVKRTDISLTLFLDPPDSYDGGELLFEQGNATMKIKLPARSVVTYPSTTLHQVTPVTRGTRTCVVAWIQSMVRDAGCREILYDLDVAKRMMFRDGGKSRQHDLVSKAWANLIRRWAEP